MRKIAIYADTGDIREIGRLARLPQIKGFTTNPTIMRKAGVIDYRAFAHSVLDVANGKPVSFEVFADDFETMERQAREIASWGKNVYVKIPVTNTEANPSFDLIWRLARAKVNVNVTAVLTAQQARIAVNSLDGNGIVSIFAGRIADTGADPARVMRSAKGAIKHPGVKLLWASTREVYNVVQAEEAGCDIITLSPDLIAKLDGFGRDLAAYSLETVRQFHRDASGLTL